MRGGPQRVTTGQVIPLACGHPHTVAFNDPKDRAALFFCGTCDGLRATLPAGADPAPAASLSHAGLIAHVLLARDAMQDTFGGQASAEGGMNCLLALASFILALHPELGTGTTFDERDDLITLLTGVINEEITDEAFLAALAGNSGQPDDQPHY